VTLAAQLRELRSSAKTSVPNSHTLPIPTIGQSRYLAARHAVLTASDTAAIAAAWEEYRDVWTDALTSLGHVVIEHLERK
jgi:hypothetical protein